MGTLLVEGLFGVLRVLLAGLVMIGVALGLWLVVGVGISTLGAPGPALVAVSAVGIGFIAFAAGGYLSARYITRRSWLHPALAAVAIGLSYEFLFSSGDIGGLAIGIPFGAGLFAVAGAEVGRRLTYVGADRGE